MQYLILLALMLCLAVLLVSTHSMLRLKAIGRLNLQGSCLFVYLFYLLLTESAFGSLLLTGGTIYLASLGIEMVERAEARMDAIRDEVDSSINFLHDERLKALRPQGEVGICSRCVYYSHSTYLVCCIHPSGPGREDCLDYRGPYEDS